MHPDSQSSAQELVETAAGLQGEGKLAEAEACVRDALRIDPGHAASLDLLGLIQVQARRPREALQTLQRALMAKPERATTQLYFGHALVALNRPQEALVRYIRASALDPGLADAHASAGSTLSSLGQYEKAVHEFETALDARPDDVSTLNNLANALSMLGRRDEARVCFERALATDPQFLPAHYNLGIMLAAMEQHEEAVEHFRAVIAEWPGDPKALFNLGNSLFALFRAAEALEVYDRLMAVEPRFMPGHLAMGNVLQALGRLDEARAAYERALSLSPNAPTLHRAVAEIKQFREGDAQLRAMEALAREIDQFPVLERVSLHFALAKAYDDLGRHADAFANWQRGNALKRQTIVYDEAAVLGHLRDIEAAFTAELLSARRGHGDPSELPVFVLGMPRSGTTLIEQMLASHPRAHGAGELRHWLDLVEGGHAGRNFPGGVSPLSDGELREIGHQYVERLGAHAPQAERIVDKLPANFRYIGLIHLTLPRARIIHVRRDPADTCFSCYSKLFVNGLEYTCDLGELGRYYRAYDSLMEHWRRVLPADAMLEVRYEDLVADFEPQARRIVEYCGLEWDERCLRFHEAERPIFTVSVQQVRKPLFSSSVGRWRHYRTQLGPLLDVLGFDPDR